MIVINPNVEIMHHEDYPEKDMQFIERVGRTCYKSEDMITPISASKFVENLVKRKHLAMLEHEYIYLTGDKRFYEEFTSLAHINPGMHSWRGIKYFNIIFDGNVCFISGSFRAFMEYFDRWEELYNSIGAIFIDITISALRMQLEKIYPIIFPHSDFWEDENKSGIKRETELENMFKNDNYVRQFSTIYVRSAFINAVKSYSRLDEEGKKGILFNLLPHTVRFTCDRGICMELLRHRPMAWAMESTRYCLYSKDKFGGQIRFVKPCFFEEGTEQYELWHAACELSETTYMKLVNNGATAQEARDVLNHSVAAELVGTGTGVQWRHMIKLRYQGTTGTPHPQMVEIFEKLYPDLYDEINYY